jgi:hypothetical protein
MIYNLMSVSIIIIVLTWALVIFRTPLYVLVSEESLTFGLAESFSE